MLTVVGPRQRRHIEPTVIRSDRSGSTPWPRASTTSTSATTSAREDDESGDRRGARPGPRCPSYLEVAACTLRIGRRRPRPRHLRHCRARGRPPATPPVRDSWPSSGSGPRGESGLVAARPPGHHALADRAMGFCLLNNVAVTAQALAEEGERVAIVDWDVHHGNGTQAIFWDDPQVLYVSLHQWPCYPGTGRSTEVAGPHAPGLTVNLPSATGDDRRRRGGCLRAGGRPGHRVVRSDLDAGVGRLRRPSGRPARRPGLVSRRLRSLGHQGGRPGATRPPPLHLEGGYDLRRPPRVGGCHPGSFARLRHRPTNRRPPAARPVVRSTRS